MQILCAIRAHGPISQYYSSQTRYRAFNNLHGSVLPHTSASKRTRTRARISTRASSSSSPEVHSRTSQTLTLLHKTRSFLPHAFGHQGSSDSLEFWNRTFSEISDDLSIKEMAETKVRVVSECPD